MSDTSTSSTQLLVASIEGIYKVKQDFAACHNRVLSAVRMSSLTQRLLTKDFALLPSSEPSDTIYGIPLITDESIPLNQYRVEWPTVPPKWYTGISLANSLSIGAGTSWSR